MDLIYGRSSDTEDGNENELPTNLPELPAVLNHVGKIESKDEVMSKDVIIPIQGTDITLETQEDINEWIKQRKLNWMKKISNKRPKENQKIIKPKRDLKNNKVIKPKETKFNLNKTIIQRENENSENKLILEFIKELFNSKTLQN